MPFLLVSLKVHQKVPFTSKCTSRHASILLFPFHLLPPSHPTSQPHCRRGIRGTSRCKKAAKVKETGQEEWSFQLSKKPESLLVALQHPRGAGRRQPAAWWPPRGTALATAPATGPGSLWLSGQAPVTTDGFNEL